MKWIPRATLPIGIVMLATAAAMTITLFEGAGWRGTAAGDPPSRSEQPSVSDPEHLWNRLRNRLHVRVESEFALPPERLSIDPNEHDPLHWSRIWFPEPVEYLFKGAPYREAISLLDEFLINHGEKIESDPLQRALLQHDLWAVFDYVSDPDWSNPLQSQPPEKRYGVERRELCWRLARAIDRLALTKEEIGKLPDNYASAVAAKMYPRHFDPRRPDQPFLPPNLWDPEGPWVLVSEWASNPLAIRHTAFFGGRSTFAVFLRLPEGRAATEKYLNELRAWKPPAGESIPPGGNAVPPQVPQGTQFALARRMLVVSDAGDLVPTRLTESLQIRSLPGDGTQSFLEFRLRRQALLSGKGGGLSAVAQDERERSDMLDLGPRNDSEKHEPILASCRTCHTNQGILSMNSYTGSMDNVSRLRGLRTLADGSLKGQEDATIAWKQNQYSWGLLNGLKQGRAE